MMAAVAVEGVASNAMMTNVFSAGVGVGNNDLAACVDSIRDIAKRVQAGELSDCDQVLVAQTVTLNAMFAELPKRAAINMGTSLDLTDRDLRVAFNTQAQSRCKADSLAEMENPRQVTFAKQVNNANGPQQVNNGTAPVESAEGQSTRTEETVGAPNELLEV